MSSTGNIHSHGRRWCISFSEEFGGIGTEAIEPCLWVDGQGWIMAHTGAGIWYADTFADRSMAVAALISRNWERVHTLRLQASNAITRAQRIEARIAELEAEIQGGQ